MTHTRIYTVHVDPNSGAPDGAAVFVKEGFAWGAALFTVLWALRFRLWLAALVIAALVVGVEQLADEIELHPIVDAAAGLAAALVIGFEGNDWRRRGLARRGFVEAGIIAAPNLIEAERRFFDRFPPAFGIAQPAG